MNSPELDALFQPFQIKSLALKNRIVMAPMTRSSTTESGFAKRCICSPGETPMGALPESKRHP